MCLLFLVRLVRQACTQTLQSVSSLQNTFSTQALFLLQIALKQTLRRSLLLQNSRPLDQLKTSKLFLDSRTSITTLLRASLLQLSRLQSLLRLTVRSAFYQPRTSTLSSYSRSLRTLFRARAYLLTSTLTTRYSQRLMLRTLLLLQSYYKQSLIAFYALQRFFYIR